jgi:hypothetical protein
VKTLIFIKKHISKRPDSPYLPHSSSNRFTSAAFTSSTYLNVATRFRREIDCHRLCGAPISQSKQISKNAIISVTEALPLLTCPVNQIP